MNAKQFSGGQSSLPVIALTMSITSLQLIRDCGVQHTKEWWLGACLSTLIPVIYSFTGGMRASLVTDVAQSVTCVGFLIGLIIVLGVNAPASFGSWDPTGMLTTC